MSALVSGGVVFAQSFSLGDVTGGARILRSVCDQAPVPVSSLCTRAMTSPTTPPVEESVLPLRPSLGRLERTRFGFLTNLLEPLFAPHFRRRLEKRWRVQRPGWVHLLPHGWGDFVESFRVAQSLNLPVALSMHDDLAFTAARHPRRGHLLKVLEELWRGADVRYVICEALGREYSRRYGERPFLVHSDGQAPLRSQARTPRRGSAPFEIYFMGLFLNNYAENLRVLIRALESLRQSRQWSRPIKMRLRCHSVALGPGELPDWVEVLPFASEEVVRQEMLAADCLYLPLPFQDAARDFSRLSFSTKLVSYLSSGVPILCHGPAYAAATCYLAEHGAALLAMSLEEQVLRDQLLLLHEGGAITAEVASRGLRRCKTDFDPPELRGRFWAPLLVGHSHPSTL